MGTYDFFKKSQKTVKLLIGLMCAITIFFVNQAEAGISGAAGFRPDMNSSSFVCGSGNVTTQIAVFKGGACYIQGVGNYVPHSGYYTVILYAYPPGNWSQAMFNESSRVYISSDKSISEQSLYVTTSDRNTSVYLYNKTVYNCYSLKDDAGNYYSLNSVTCRGDTPLPPTPTPDTACTLNSGNALNVNLGTVDRSQLTTTPGVGSVKHILVNVNCTGGVDVTVNMQLNYTPISITGTQIVKSTANGLGVAIIYNGKTLASADVTPVTFLSGSNTLDLSFQAVRDPTVDVGDVPTGAFTASAVLVMTQQ